MPSARALRVRSRVPLGQPPSQLLTQSGSLYRSQALLTLTGLSGAFLPIESSRKQPHPLTGERSRRSESGAGSAPGQIFVAAVTEKCASADCAFKSRNADYKPSKKRSG